VSESEEKDEVFREWKEVIDKRCAEHVEKHPEYKPLKSVDKPLFEYTTFGVDSEKSNLRVEVRESLFNVGNWVVIVGGIAKESFAGPFAHYNATKYAANTLNAIQKGNDRGVSSGLPDTCIHCGGRFSHRAGCPDS
jgi:hypothetical protein